MSTILQDSEVPLYMQVSEWVRGKIYKGELGKGDRIPSENQIMEILQVSRGTVKKGVTMLVNEGLLVQVQGKGTLLKRKISPTHLAKGCYLSLNRLKASTYLLRLRLLMLT